jgi:hypothetical protein
VADRRPGRSTVIAPVVGDSRSSVPLVRAWLDFRAQGVRRVL